MKPWKLEEISKEKYFVKDKCTYVQLDEKSSKKLCNFYVSKLTQNLCIGQPYSYSITIVSEKNEKFEVSVPCYYLTDPYTAIKLKAESDEFKISCTKRVFNENMEEIFDFMNTEGEAYERESIAGWSEDAISYGKKSDLPFREKKYYSFNKVENPFLSIEYTKFEAYDNKPANKISESLDILDTSMAIPLFSFMLLSLLNEFQLPAENRKPDLILAITGGTSESRRKTALFFTNLYKRDPALTSIEHKQFHVTTNDIGIDIKIKAMQAKDCPLIVFEPDKRQLNFILKKVYHTNDVTVIEDSKILEEQYPVRSLCVFTRESVEDIKADNIIEICLDNFPDACKKYKTCSSLNDDYIDEVSASIYYYISKLAHKMYEEGIDYIKNKYNSFCDKFRNLHPETDYSDKAYESTMLLLFAFKLCMEEYDDCELSEELYQKAFDAISRAAEDSFPLGGIPTYTNFDNAKNICRTIDSYFSPVRNKKYAARLGQNKELNDIWLWYDDECFYLTVNSIENILKIQGIRLRLSTDERKALHQKGLIKVHKTKNGGLEYTVHYQKPLHGKKTTKKRFVAFKREECRKYNLFEKLEETCSNLDEIQKRKILVREIKAAKKDGLW